MKNNTQKKLRINNTLLFGTLFAFAILFSLSLDSAELDLKINAKLNGFDTDLYLQSDPTASLGFDYLDFQQQNFPNGNYSFLSSDIGTKNLTMDAWPLSSRTFHLVYKVNPTTSGTLNLSWSTGVFGSSIDAILRDYAADGAYSSSIASVNMKTSGFYSVFTSDSARYFSVDLTYYYSGDGVCSSAIGENCGNTADCACGSGYSCTGGSCVSDTGGEIPPVIPPIVIPPVIPPVVPPVIVPIVPAAVAALSDGSCLVEDKNLVCGDWSDCTAQYGFSALVSDGSLVGAQTRRCSDKTKCVPDFIDTRKCNFRENVTVKNTFWCNQNYTEVFNDKGNVIARLKKVSAERAVTVDLNTASNAYCAYCFDNVKNYDETGVDCGGSCISCSDKTLAIAGKWYSQGLFGLSISLFFFLMFLVSSLLTSNKLVQTIRYGILSTSFMRRYAYWKNKGYDVNVLDDEVNLLRED